MIDKIDELIRLAEVNKFLGGDRNERANFRDILANFLGGDESGKFDDTAGLLRKEADLIRRNNLVASKIVVSKQPKNN